MCSSKAIRMCASHVVEPFSACLRRISTPEGPAVLETTHTQTEPQHLGQSWSRVPVCLSHSCACAWTELLLLLKAARVLSFSSITNHCTMDICLCLMTCDQQLVAPSDCAAPALIAAKAVEFYCLYSLISKIMTDHITSPAYTVG